MTNKKNRISIQVGLSGYSFKIEAGDSIRSSGWMSADRVFTTPEFQKRYSQVDISVFTPKFALIPSHFHHPLRVRQNLAEVAREIIDGVDFVVNPRCEGKPTKKPSSIIAFGEGGEVKIIRE